MISESGAATVSPRASVASVALVRRGDDRVLCVWNRRYRGWSLPGGLVEGGETIWAALARELQEETSLELRSAKLLFEGPHHVQVPNGRASHVSLFQVMGYRGQPREMEPGCPVTWLTMDEFVDLTPFSSFYAEAFKACPPVPCPAVARDRDVLGRQDLLDPSVQLLLDHVKKCHGADKRAFSLLICAARLVLDGLGASTHPDLAEAARELLR